MSLLLTDLPANPLQFAFMQEAYFKVLVLAFVTATVGRWIVLRGIGFFAHTATAYMLPPAILAVSLNLPTLLGTIIGAAIAFLTQLLSSRGHQTKTALNFTAMLSITVLIASYSENGGAFDSLLFGTLFSSESYELKLITFLLLTVTVLTLACSERKLRLAIVNPENNRATQTVVLLATVLTLALVISFTGVLLASSFLIIPVLVAVKLTRSLKTLFLTTGITAAIVGSTGLTVSYYLDLPPSATITVTAGGLLLIIAGSQTLQSKLRSKRAVA